MTPERWAKIEEIFQAALDCEPTLRAAFIAEKCGGEAELCREVKKLIERYDTGNPFLESPVWTDSVFFQTTLKNQIASSLDKEVADFEEDESLAGQLVGAYRLTEEIGRGGMGVVYAATRDEDFQQKVAVKIVKRGMDTDFVLSRFRQERQVLAALSHPNVARLLDGGATEDGRPFLVMEFIEGVPIDRFCDERKLTIQERLKLFREVCAAVGYSHQRLIIHRDIKPSNILVTADGAPKLLDFGIAKLLDSTLASASYQPTATAARMLTPDYASPEQLRGEEITTVSDVYSLGVLLYFLLIGHLPFNFNAGRLDVFAGLVSEQKPERPSALITRSGKTTAKNRGAKTGDQALIKIAGNRATEPERLRRYLADDLDNIVLKALRKESDRRYSSVEQLSEDIRRHLEGLPVKARGDNFSYKFRKFVQRHRASVIAAALLFLTLLGGIAATSWQARIARQESLRAEAESERAQRRFNESRRLTESLMFELHDAIRDLQGATPARELLAKKTLEHLDSLIADAENDATLQSELAIAYINLGNIQGNPYYPNLGDVNGALESYRKAEKLTEAMSTANPNDVKLVRRYWLTQIRIGDIQTAQGDLPNAAQSYARASLIIEDLTAKNHDDELLRGDLASSYDRQGNVLMRLNDFQSALEIYDKAQTIFEWVSAARPDDDNALRAAAAGHGKLGTAYLKSGAIEKSIESYKRLLEINEARLRKNPSNAVTLDDVAGSRREFADAQMAAGNNAAAFESYRRQLEIHQQLAAADSANVKTSIELVISHQRLGYLQTRTGDAEGGRKNYENALAILQKLKEKNSQNLSIENQLAAVNYYLGDADFILASKSSGNAAKTRLLNAARSYFQKSNEIYSVLPTFNVSFPQGTQQLEDIQNRIAACQTALSK